MAENSKPKISKLELLGEMSKLATDNIKDRGISFADSLIKGKGFLGAYLRSAFMSTLTPYAIPTRVRQIKEIKYFKTTNAEDLGIFLGFLTGVISNVFVVYDVLKSEHNELLYIPLATNILSGVYEFTKPIYKKAKENLEYMTMHRAADEKTKEAAGQLERQKEKPAEKPFKEKRPNKEYL
jgi:hypothetical protein